MMTMYVLCMLVGCILLHLVICRLLKIKYEYVVLSMVGCIVDGPTSSLTAAGANWKSLINVGLIMGVLAGAAGRTPLKSASLSGDKQSAGAVVAARLV